VEKGPKTAPKRAFLVDKSLSNRAAEDRDQFHSTERVFPQVFHSFKNTRVSLLTSTTVAIHRRKYSPGPMRQLAPVLREAVSDDRPRPPHEGDLCLLTAERV